MAHENPVRVALTRRAAQPPQPGEGHLEVVHRPVPLLVGPDEVRQELRGDLRASEGDQRLQERLGASPPPLPVEDDRFPHAHPQTPEGLHEHGEPVRVGRDLRAAGGRVEGPVEPVAEIRGAEEARGPLARGNPRLGLLEAAAGLLVPPRPAVDRRDFQEGGRCEQAESLRLPPSDPVLQVIQRIPVPPKVRERLADHEGRDPLRNRASGSPPPSDGFLPVQEGPVGPPEQDGGDSQVEVGVPVMEMVPLGHGPCEDLPGQPLRGFFVPFEGAAISWCDFPSSQMEGGKRSKKGWPIVSARIRLPSRTCPEAIRQDPSAME